MKSTPKIPDLKWTRNLYEATGTIREAQAEVDCRVAAAKKRFQAAMREYEQELAGIKQYAEGVERRVSRDWNPEEIAAAKRGKMLVDGREIEVTW